MPVRAQSRNVPHVSVAESDGSCFVKSNLKGKTSYWLFAGDSDMLPLDHKDLTWR